MANPVVSVIVCTVNRPKLLPVCVRSLVEQENSRGLDFEIVVVDNNPKGTNRALVEELQQQSRVPIVYVHEQTPGISYARNCGIRTARAPWVGFVDDDNIASPNWLDDIFAAAEKFQPALIGARVLNFFEDDAKPDWDPTGQYFTRTVDLPTGCAQDWVACGNMLFEREKCVFNDEPFNLARSFSGGEDYEFSMHCRSRGGNIIWCNEATVRATIPKEIITKRYVFERQYAGTLAFVDVTVQFAKSKALARLGFLAKGILQNILLTPPFLLGHVIESNWLFDCQVRFYRGLAKIAAARGGSTRFWDPEA